jgi:hypothetical protein
MYQSLLDKARQNAALRESALNSEQAAKSKVDSVDSLTPASSINKQKQSEPKEEQVLSSATAKERDRTNDVAQGDSGSLSADPGEVAQKPTKSEAGKQSKSNQPTIFQAVGLIRCTPRIEGDKLFVTIGDRDYKLKKGRGRWRKQFDELKQEIEQHGSTEMLLRVYPQIIHDSKNQEIRYWFTLVRASSIDESQCSDNREDFIFRGIWNIVPYCDEPVISIHRNINTLGFYQRLSFKAKKAFIRPQDFPVVWSAPIEPFQYNPELDPREQMPRYFVQVRAIFKDGRFEVVETIEKPTLDVPRYIKSPKKNQNTLSQQKNS